MADKIFQLEVITPERTAVSGEVSSLQVTASDGMMGVLTGHAPLIAQLGVGPMKVKDGGGKESHLALGEGFIEVFKNQVKVLADFAEFAGEIDVERAEQAKDRAQDRLKHRLSPDVNEIRAEAALRRAMVRLKVGNNN